MSPSVIRWGIEDFVGEAREDWSAQPCGLWVDSELLRVLAWADDTWLFAVTDARVDAVIAILRRVAKQVAGLELPLKKCIWAKVCRRRTAASALPTEASRDRSTRRAVRKCATNGEDSIRHLSQGTRGPYPARRRPRGRVPTSDPECIEVLPQQGRVVESMRLLEKHVARHASFGLAVPRLLRRVQALDPEGTPGCQDGTSPHDTQESW